MTTTASSSSESRLEFYFQKICLASCEIRLQSGSHSKISPSEISRQLLSLPANEGSSQKRDALEKQLQAHALFQSHLGELDRVILPRLSELLIQLLQYPRKFDLGHHPAHIQVAVSVMCAGLLSHGLPGAPFSRVFRDEKLRMETPRFSEFLELQKSKCTSNDNYMRAQAREALLEEVAEWKKKYRDLASRAPQDGNSKWETKIKTLENQRGQDLLKITELEKRKDLDHRRIAKLTDEQEKAEKQLELLRLELQKERTRSKNELHAERHKSTQSESEHRAALRLRDDELGSLRSKLQSVQAELDVERAKSSRGDSEHQAALNSASCELDGVRSQLQTVQKKLDAERENLRRSESKHREALILRDAELDSARSEHREALILRDAKLDSVRSQLKIVQDKLDAERESAAQSDSEHQVALSLRDVELDGVRSQLQNVRDELEGELKNSTQRDSEHRAALSSRDAELEGVRSELKCVQAELNAERAQSIRGDSNDAKLEHLRSELQHVRTELDVERQNSSKSDSEHQAALSSRDAKLDSVHSQLQNVQKELDAERENSTRFASEHKAALSLRDDALEGVRYKLQRVQTELDVERAKPSRGDSQHVELEHIRSELQHVRAELDVERQNSTKSNSEHQAALSSRDAELESVRSRLQIMQKELHELAIGNLTRFTSEHPEVPQDAEFDGACSQPQDVQEELDTERDRVDLVRSDSERHAAMSQDANRELDIGGEDIGFDIRGQSRSIATSVSHAGGTHQPPAFSGLLDERPRKVARQSKMHTFALESVQQEGFHITYVGDQFHSSPEQLVLPQTPEEGCHWQQIYMKYNLAQLAHAQLDKAKCDLVKVDMLCQHCRDQKQVCLRRAKAKRENEACLICLVGNRKCSAPKDNRLDAYPFKDPTFREAFVSLHNVTVRKRQIPGRWMGKGVPEFNVAWNAPPKKKRKTEA